MIDQTPSASAHAAVPASGQVSLENWMTAPHNRWAFTHVDALMPTASLHVGQETDPVSSQQDRLQGFRFVSEGKSFSLFDWLQAIYADALLVTRSGQTLYEYYRLEQDVDRPHICMSVSKSILGLAAGAISRQCRLDLDRTLTFCMPELKGTAFDGATIRQALDMQVGIPYEEDYYAQQGAMVAYRSASHWAPPSASGGPSTLIEFLQTLTDPVGMTHGSAFNYASPVTDLLGCLLERVSGQSYASLLAELFWSGGAAHSTAYITTDRAGAPRAAGGLCATPRDLERIARLFLTDGTAQGRELIPRDWIADILDRGDPDAWRKGNLYSAFGERDMHYRSQWYVERGPRPLVMAAGIFGQRIFIDPELELIAIVMASRPAPTDPMATVLTHAAITELRRQLGG